MSGRKKIKQVAALKYSPEENNAPQIIGLEKARSRRKYLKRQRKTTFPYMRMKSLPLL